MLRKMLFLVGNSLAPYRTCRKSESKITYV
jgi:hypothetical protein